MAYRVKAGAVVAVVGGADRYFERGAVLPAEVENLAHLKAVGLVEEFALPVIEDGAEFVEGAAGSDPAAPTVKAEPVKPQAKPAAK